MAKGTWTDYELEILLAVGEGLTNAEIVDRHGGSVRSVSNEIRRIVELIGLHGRVDLMFWVLRNTEYEPDDELLVEAAEQMLKLTDHMRLLLNIMVRVCLTQRAEELSELKYRLEDVRDKLRREKPTDDVRQSLLVLDNVLESGLGVILSRALQSLGIPRQPEGQWPKLVRYAYLALIFELTHPNIEKAP